MITTKTEAMPQKIEATPQNINDTITNIVEYAKAKGYDFDAKDISTFRETPIAFWQGKSLEFESKRKKKTCSNYLTRFSRKITMSQANRFLHFLWRHVLKNEGTAPEIKYSQRELDIRAARKTWKAAEKAAEELRLAYKNIKGDFYK